jgi:hypothetical protein
MVRFANRLAPVAGLVALLGCPTVAQAASSNGKLYGTLFVLELYSIKY